MKTKQITQELTQHAKNVYNNKNGQPYLITYDYIDLIIKSNTIKYKLIGVYEAYIYYNTNQSVTVIFYIDAGYEYAETQITVQPESVEDFKTMVVY